MATESVEQAARELRLATGRFARKLRRLFVEADASMSFLELGVLHHLLLDGPTSPTGLAAAEDVSGPAVAEALRHLEQVGAVSRTRSTSDRRSVVVALTDKGRESLDVRNLVVVERIAGALERGLDERGLRLLREFLPLLEKVTHEL